MAKAKSNGHASSKASTVREFIQQNPTMSGAQVIAALAEQGLKVASSEVSMARRKLGLSRRTKRGKGRAKGRAKAAKAAPAARTKSAANPLSAAIDFVKSLGGLKQAQAALNQLNEIRELAK